MVQGDLLDSLHAPSYRTTMIRASAYSYYYYYATRTTGRSSSTR